VLIESEVEIMDLWDTGNSMEVIVERTGKTRRYVNRILRRYTPKAEDNFEPRVRAGTDRLLAAIQSAGVRPA
jgi:transposase